MLSLLAAATTLLGVDEMNAAAQGAHMSVSAIKTFLTIVFFSVNGQLLMVVSSVVVWVCCGRNVITFVTVMRASVQLSASADVFVSWGAVVPLLTRARM